MLHVTTPPPQPSPKLTGAERTARIRELNDDFRTNGAPVCLPFGRKLITPGIRGLGIEAMASIALQVMRYTDFSESNDPRGEHDFGDFDYAGRKIFWKIDYYDRTCDNGSPDPADPAVTCRVLTVLLADEY